MKSRSTMQARMQAYNIKATCHYMDIISRALRLMSRTPPTSLTHDGLSLCAGQSVARSSLIILFLAIHSKSVCGQAKR